MDQVILERRMPRAGETTRCVVHAVNATAEAMKDHER